MKLVYTDSNHNYFRDGQRVKSASKVAEIAADSFMVEQWRDRMVAIGMTLDRTLAERVAVDPTNRKAVQAVADDAKQAAKAEARARRGQQRHRVLELLLLGRTDQFITEQQQADAKVLERTLDAYGLEPMVDRVEQFVDWPHHGVVGRYDAYLKHRGAPVLTDLKGGPNAVLYPHSTAVQMWLYRNAPLTSKRIERDGDTYTAIEWTTQPPDAADEFGYVIYCDDHHEVGELWRIDLAGARVGGELALGIVEWRRKHDYGRELARRIEEPPVDRRAALLARYRAMSEDEQTAYRNLDVDRDNLDAVEAALDNVDRFNVMIPPVAPRRLEIVPPPTAPDEGDDVDVALVLELSARYALLPDEAEAWTGALVAQGNDGHPWQIRGKPTERRYRIYRGVLALAEEFHGGDDIIRAIMRQITLKELAEHYDGEPYDSTAIEFPTTPPGVALGLLDADQAQQFATIAAAVADNTFALVYPDGDGLPTLTPVA